MILCLCECPIYKLFPEQMRYMYFFSQIFVTWNLDQFSLDHFILVFDISTARDTAMMKLILIHIHSFELI